MGQPVVLVGHPFAPIGMGEHLRATFRVLRAARIQVRLLDVYGLHERDPDLTTEFGALLVDKVGPGPAIFCINGDEVEPILAHLGQRAEGIRTARDKCGRSRMSTKQRRKWSR